MVSEKNLDLESETRGMVNSNFNLPAEVYAEFQAIGERFGRHNKVRWAVASAAVLSLLRLSGDDQRALVARIIGSRALENGLRDLIAEFKPHIHSTPDEASQPIRPQPRRALKGRG